jgi:hypothetical protein
MMLEEASDEVMRDVEMDQREIKETTVGDVAGEGRA